MQRLNPSGHKSRPQHAIILMACCHRGQGVSAPPAPWGATHWQPDRNVMVFVSS